MKNQILSAPYCITLLPSQEVVARCETLQEAVAFMKTYNGIMAGNQRRAVIEQAPVIPVAKHGVAA
jgi:hypothetical protein